MPLAPTQARCRNCRWHSRELWVDVIQVPAEGLAVHLLPLLDPRGHAGEGGEGGGEGEGQGESGEGSGRGAELGPAQPPGTRASTRPLPLQWSRRDADCFEVILSDGPNILSGINQKLHNQVIFNIHHSMKIESARSPRACPGRLLWVSRGPAPWGLSRGGQGWPASGNCGPAQPPGS